MPRIRIDRFQGLAPRFDRRSIPVGAAQIAENLRFDAGDLKPFQEPVPDSASTPLGATGADIGNLFRWRHGQDERWISFGRNMHVTASRSPVPNDSHRRWYWNVNGGPDEQGLFAISLADHTQPTPNGASSGQGSNYREFNGYRLGIPAPIKAPSASPAEGNLVAVGWDTDNAITTLSRTNPVTVNVSGEHGFKAGQRVRFKVNPDHPKPGEDDDEEGPPPGDGDGNGSEPDGQVWSLDGQEGVVANVSGSSFDVTGVSTSMFEEFTEDDLANLRVERYLVDQDLESRTYVYTYVSEFGEEGPPSPPSNIVDVEREGVVNLEIVDSAWQPSHGGSREFADRIRIYRSVVESSGASFFVLVGTLTLVSEDSPDSSLIWTSEPTIDNFEGEWAGGIVDPVTSVELGEPLPSRDWYPPPNDLDGITMLANGIMAGWRNNEIRFSEPYLPHAWNPDSFVTLTDDVVGADSFRDILVVGTRGRPYIVTGADPASMRAQRMEHHAPLLNPRAIADAGTGVIYAADNGLVWVGQGGTRVMTPKFTKEDWLAVAEQRTHLDWFDSYALLYAPGVQPLILSMVGEEVEASYLDMDFSAVTRKDNSLAVVKRQGVSGNPYRIVWLFNEGEDVVDGPIRMEGRHRGGLVTFRRPCNPAIGQVFADGYPLTLTVRAIRPGSYPEPVAGQPDLSVLDEHEYTVVGPEPFRMGAGFVSREYEIEILSTHRVQSVVIATSMDELRQEP